MSNIKLDDRPVFVLTTSTTCGPCQYFKKHTWPDLYKKLKDDKKLKIVHIEVPSQGIPPDPDKYHSAMRNFIGWYPTMSIFLAADWEKKEEGSVLRGIIKNGAIVKIDGVDSIQMIGNSDISEKSILKWIDDSLNNNNLFNINSKKNNLFNNKNKVSDKIKVPTKASYIRKSKSLK